MSGLKVIHVVVINLQYMEELAVPSMQSTDKQLFTKKD